MAENITQTDKNTPSQSAENKKRYYWLKLMDDFFDSKYIKILRKKDGGDKNVIIYLMLQLRALKNDGVINFEQLMPTVEEEVAIEIGEDIEEVKTAIDALKSMNLVEVLEDGSIFMCVKEELLNYGSETTAAERQRKSRERRKNEQSGTKEILPKPQNQNSDEEVLTVSKDNSETEYTPAFSQFWDAYPRKIGKGEAYKNYTARRKDGFSDEELLIAAKNYAIQVKKQKTDKQYIKHPKTFLDDTKPFVDFIQAKTETPGYDETPICGNPFKNWGLES